MALYVSTGDGVVDYRNVDLFWDVVVGNGVIDLYWGRNGGIWCSTSLLGTMLKRMTLHISSRDGLVGLALYFSTKDGVVE